MRPAHSVFWVDCGRDGGGVGLMSGTCRLAGSGVAGSYEGFAHGGEQAGQRDGLTTGGPRCSVHSDQELGARVWGPEEQDFEVFFSVVIFNRNSQVRLHKPRKGQPVTKVNRARGCARSTG